MHCFLSVFGLCLASSIIFLSEMSNAIDHHELTWNSLTKWTILIVPMRLGWIITIQPLLHTNSTARCYNWDICFRKIVRVNKKWITILTHDILHDLWIQCSKILILKIPLYFSWLHQETYRKLQVDELLSPSFLFNKRYLRKVICTFYRWILFWFTILRLKMDTITIYHKQPI